MLLSRLIEAIRPPAHEWHWDALPPFKTVIGIDGSVLRDNVMRRKVKSEWQFRAMTPEEMEENAERQAI